MAERATRALAPNHQTVFSALKRAARPLTAYQLIDAVRASGISAPPTVYRALARLIEDGRAHRLESLNAFVACTHSHDSHGSTVFMICDDCGSAEEFTDHAIAERLDERARETGFRPKAAAIEIHGSCSACSKDSPLKSERNKT